MQHTPGAAQRLQPLCPPGPHAEPGGGVSQPCSPEPGHGRGLHPHPPQQHRGVTQGRGEEAGRRPVVLRPGVVLLSGLLIAPVSVVLFFFPSRCFVPSCSRFAARGRVVLRSGFRFALRFALLPAFHFAHLLFVSFRAPFSPPRTPSYFVRLFLHTLPIGSPFSLRSPWVCTPFSLRTPFPHPPLLAHPFSLPHTPQPPQTRGAPPHPTPNPPAPHIRGRSAELGRSAGRTEDPAQLTGN